MGRGVGCGQDADADVSVICGGVARGGPAE